MRPWVLGTAVLACLVVSGAGTVAHAEGACQRVELVDAETGESVRGTEDIVLDREGRRLFVSAYDRWAVEDAVAGGARTLPQGGLYAVALDDVAARPASLPVSNLAADVGSPFHPHGIGFYHGGDTRRLAVVNHAYGRHEGDWRSRTRIDLFEVDAADGPMSHRGTLESPRLCHANDIVPLSGADLLATREYGACGGVRRWAEVIFGLREAKVLHVQHAPEEDGMGAEPPIDALIDDLGLANGIALGPDGRTLAVAATREQRVRFYDVVALLAGEGERALATTVDLDGGPDNLGWRADGQLLVAVHPSLMGAGMARYRWFGRDRAGSRVVAIDPQTGESTLLVDDSDGELLNMATSTTAFDDVVVAAGVLDSALLVCSVPDGAEDLHMAADD